MTCAFTRYRNRALTHGVRLVSEWKGPGLMARAKGQLHAARSYAATGGPRGQALALIQSATKRGTAGGQTASVMTSWLR